MPISRRSQMLVAAAGILRPLQPIIDVILIVQSLWFVAAAATLLGPRRVGPAPSAT